jgi:hypothetical protein
MSLAIWAQEGNDFDLSFWFKPPPEEQKSSQAPDTPSYLDETRYVKAWESKEPPKVDYFPLIALLALLFFMGVIKL